ncbi:MAG TPA: helix-turn-helix domain-containing protein [Nostocaceae cyanobacterium]|nr:helix-turn-helix domain-containing protein [Nostocaceae cyanobacterium]
MAKWHDKNTAVTFSNDHIIPPCRTYRIKSEEIANVGTQLNLSKLTQPQVFKPNLNQKPRPYIQNLQQQVKERNAQIVQRARNGETPEAIAEDVGLAVSTVKTVLRKAGIFFKK